MKTVTLVEYVKATSQGAAAKALGITQGAISQMLKKDRTVFVVLGDQNQILDCYEQKPIGGATLVGRPQEVA